MTTNDPELDRLLDEEEEIDRREEERISELVDGFIKQVADAYQLNSTASPEEQHLFLISVLAQVREKLSWLISTDNARLRELSRRTPDTIVHATKEGAN